MKKNLILYFSNTGNNKFLAEKFAEKLESDINKLELKPKSFFLLLLFSFLKISPFIKPTPVEKYERVILLSPIWMGNVVSPVRGFLKKNRKNIKSLVYITVCGGDEEDKDGKFGYEGVFTEVRKLFGKTNFSAHAISVKFLDGLEKNDVMSVRLDEKLFAEKMKERFDEIVRELKSSPL